MKKYEVIVEDAKAVELTSLLEKLPYVTYVRESNSPVNPYTLASEKSLGEEWLLKDDDKLQKLYSK